MQVTKENFEQVLPLFQESLNKADFIAIDTEFTGKLGAMRPSGFQLKIPISHVFLRPFFHHNCTSFFFYLGFNEGLLDSETDYDTVEERYQKIKH